MIKRDKYLNKLISSKENGFPKIITGIRRSGKSYLLEEIFKDYLISCGVNRNNIIMIDLDKSENFSLYDPINLLNYIIERCDKNKMNYILIDEIQNVVPIINPTFTNGKHVIAKSNDENIINFSKIILSLSKEKYIDLYVTGSNSKMLSTDIQTEFRDKSTIINIAPISFEEFLNYKKIDEYRAVNEYLIYGGMPLCVLKDAEEEKKEYLKNLFETTYFKDIVERYHFKKTEALDELCNILSTCVGTLINTSKIVNTYKSKTKGKIDDETVTNYINAFKDSHIIRQVNRYDVKGREEIGSLKKYYFVDNGLRNARLNFAFTDEGQMLENVIYNELIYNEYTVNIGTYDKIEKNSDGASVRKSYEIDFLATKGNRMYYIQVATDINNEETRLREIKPYISLNDQIQKIIVINKPINEMRDVNGFTIIGVAYFLTKFIK